MDQKCKNTTILSQNCKKKTSLGQFWKDMISLVQNQQNMRSSRQNINNLSQTELQTTYQPTIIRCSLWSFVVHSSKIIENAKKNRGKRTLNKNVNAPTIYSLLHALTIFFSCKYNNIKFYVNQIFSKQNKSKVIMWVWNYNAGGQAARAANNNNNNQKEIMNIKISSHKSIIKWCVNSSKEF